MPRRHRLLEEVLHAAAAMGALVIALSVLYRLVTGNSPLPFAMGEAVGFCLGLIVLVLTSPHRD